MKFTPGLGFGDFSGSAGSTTASRGRGGSYLRRRGIPTNPNTPLQVTARQAFGSLGAAYAALTDAQWEGWANYAAAVPWTNSLGQVTRLSGQQHFMRINQPRLMADALGTPLSLPIIANAPATEQLGTLPLIVQTALLTDAGPPADVIFSQTSSNSVASGFVYVYLSLAVNAAKRYFKGPYRLAAVEVPPAAGVAMDFELGLAGGSIWANQGNPLPVLGGVHYGYTRFQATDGRLSEPAYFGPVVVEAP